MRRNISINYKKIIIDSHLQITYFLFVTYLRFFSTLTSIFCNSCVIFVLIKRNFVLCLIFETVIISVYLIEIVDKQSIKQFELFAVYTILKHVKFLTDQLTRKDTIKL